MPFTPSSDDQAAEAITRLVDGTLADAERDEVTAWAAAQPDVQRQVVAQRHVAHELATGGPAVPDRLLDAVERRVAARTGAARSRADRPRRTASFGWRLPSLGVGALAAAAAVAIVIAVSGGASARPSINAAAKLAYVPATQAAPGVQNAHYLDVDYGGVTFPNYARLDVVATGRLTNRIGGRAALTVFYRLRDGSRLSYTVFSGHPLPLPSAARLVRYEGVWLRVYRMRDGLSVVTLVRSGRTCVLAARTSEDAVLGLAAEPVLVEHV